MKPYLILIFYILSSFFYKIPSQIKKINFTSKESKGIVINNKKLLILWKDVQFNHNATILKCDSAIYERTNNSFIAYQNIEVNENDSVRIYGDSIHYFGNLETAYIYGKVKVISEKITISTNQLIYDRNLKQVQYNQGAVVNDINKGYTIESKKGIFKTQNKHIFFRENVALVHKDYKIVSDSLIYHTSSQKSDIIGNAEIQTNNSRIYCKKGWFDNKNKIASFKDSVVYKNKSQILYADSVFYNEKNGTSYAEGNVEIKDDTNKFIIKGKYGIFNEITDSINVWDFASFFQYNKKDTIQIYADRFLSFSDSSKTIFICYHNAVISGNIIQGDCDSIYYNKSDSLLKCIKNPVIWMDKNQIIGDKIEFIVFEGNIYQMNIKNNSQIITKRDSIHYDQIKGEEIDGFFENNELKVLDVNVNSEAIYYTQEEGDTLVNEVNFISSESMRINIENNRIENIKFNENPKGRTEPLDGANNGLYLDDFKIIKKRTYSEKYFSAKGDSPNGN